METASAISSPLKKSSLDPAFDLCGTPWAHQLEALERAKDLQSFGLFFEPGVGKTYSAILLARYKMFTAKRPMRTLVVSPPVTLKNWRAEFLAHSRFRHEDVVCLLGTGKQRAHTMRDNVNKMVVIANYETLLMEEVFKEIVAWAPEILILDESSRIKSYNAKRTKRAIVLAKRAKYRYILTGTPVLNSPMDLFGQYCAMDLGKTFGENFFVFRSTYFFDKNERMPPQKRFPDWRIRPGAIATISAKLATSSMRVKKAECLDLPPFIRQVVKVDLSPAQRRHYDELAKDFITYVGGKACVAKMALTKALRLQQIVTGFISLEGENGDGRAISTFKDNPRLGALGDLLESITPTEKVLVWAAFRHNYGQIAEVCARLDIPYVELVGGISETKRFAALETFTQKDHCRVLIGHPGAAGVGVNLVEASSCIYYSRTFSLEHDIQSEARCYRGGSEIHKKVTRYDIVAEGTIDEHVATALAAKQAISEATLKDLARRVEESL